MPKPKSVFFCTECGNETPKWAGRCPSCGAWNTLEEVSVQPAARTQSTKKTRGTDLADKIVSLADADCESDEVRYKTGISELDRVLGGGIVQGELILVGGDPGIGKSTLLLQICQKAGEERKILYVSGEESEGQIKIRAERLGVTTENLYLVSETDVETVIECINEIKPDIVIIDSIQTMNRQDIASAAGSVPQVREATNAFMHIAKSLGISMFIVGHVTKEGAIAGPRVLEHMVDCVLYFEGDRQLSFRILRAVKNRFGSTNEIGVFEMRGQGLVEVPNPSEYMLSGKPKNASGSVVACSMEGTRPILLEIQALVARTNFGMPRRTAAGTDYNRVNLLMAVLEKRVGLQLGGCDAYVNLAGGMKLGEPAIDLGIIMAIASSYKNRPILEDTIIFGEVGLVGEVRAVSGGEARIKEAQKLGFKRCILPQANVDQIKVQTDMRLVGVSNVMEALDLI